MIGLFAMTPDPDFPGHSLLEQYQAQVFHLIIILFFYLNIKYLNNKLPDVMTERKIACSCMLMNFAIMQNSFRNREV